LGVYFGKQKSQIGQHIRELVQQIKALKCEVEYLRCDTGGENKALGIFCAEEGITLEKTVVNMPQQNRSWKEN
jgi:hypothetical protein